MSNDSNAAHDIVSCSVNWPVEPVQIDDKWPLHYLYVEQNHALLSPGLILLVSSLSKFFFLDFTYFILDVAAKFTSRLAYMKNHQSRIMHGYTQVHSVKIRILTWLPSRCQKTVGCGLPLVSQGKVAVRPCTTIWSRGRTTNWGASEVKGKINNGTIATHLFRLPHRVLLGKLAWGEKCLTKVPATN